MGMDMVVLAGLWPSDVGGWVTLISLIVGLVGAAAALVPTAIKLIKSLKTLVKNKNWKQIIAIADKAMESAEASGEAGATKKEAVIAAVKAGCEEAGIEIDQSLLDDLGKYIDEAIAWYNKMQESSASK